MWAVSVSVVAGARYSFDSPRPQYGFRLSKSSFFLADVMCTAFGLLRWNLSWRFEGPWGHFSEPGTAQFDANPLGLWLRDSDRSFHGYSTAMRASSAR